MSAVRLAPFRGQERARQEATAYTGSGVAQLDPTGGVLVMRWRSAHRLLHVRSPERRRHHAGDIMQTAMQPYIKLVQANVELLARFFTSPESVAQAAALAQSFLQPGQESAARLMQSNVFMQLVQGMLKNYTEFLTEVGQAGVAMLTQGQAAVMRQMEGASGHVFAASQTGKRGGRHNG
jgi:hypothetical protein